MSIEEIRFFLEKEIIELTHEIDKLHKVKGYDKVALQNEFILVGKLDANKKILNFIGSEINENFYGGD